MSALNQLSKNDHTPTEPGSVDSQCVSGAFEPSETRNPSKTLPPTPHSYAEKHSHACCCYKPMWSQRTLPTMTVKNSQHSPTCFLKRREEPQQQVFLLLVRNLDAKWPTGNVFPIWLALRVHTVQLTDNCHLLFIEPDHSVSVRPRCSCRDGNFISETIVMIPRTLDTRYFPALRRYSGAPLTILLGSERWHRIAPWPVTPRFYSVLMQSSEVNIACEHDRF